MPCPGRPRLVWKAKKTESVRRQISGPREEKWDIDLRVGYERDAVKPKITQSLMGCGSCRTCLEENRVVVEMMWGENRTSSGTQL